MVYWRRRQPEPEARRLLVANLHGSYQLTKEWQIYGFINNLFNRKFATVGTFFDPQSTVALAIPNVLNDHRMVTPAQPLSVYVGMRAKL
jgi:iron complex outermembrane receptor protein